MKTIGSARKGSLGLIILAIIASLSLVARIYSLSRPGATWAMEHDSTGYIRLANGLKAGCGFAPRWQTGVCGPAELQRTPGYPLFLSISSSLRSVVAIQAALGTGVCFLVALFARRRWGLPAAIIAESIIGFDLSSIIVGNLIMSEILFTSIISVAILLQLMIICRAVVDLRAIAGMLGVAFLIGIAALVRPIGQVLLIVVPLAVVPLSTISLKKRIILSMLVLSIPVGVIMSWSYRNYRQRGLWTFSTIEAANLNYTLAAGVIAYESGRSIDEVVADRLRLAGRESGPPDLWSKTFDEDPKEMMDRGLQVLLSHPSVTAFIAVKGFLRSWIMPPNRIGLSTFLGHQVDRGEANAFISRNILSTIRSTLSSRWLASIRALLFFQLAVNIFTVIGVGLAVSRAFSARSPDAWLVIIPLVAATLLLLAAAGPGESDRYRVPATPMLALIAAFGWTVGNRREAG